MTPRGSPPRFLDNIIWEVCVMTNVNIVVVSGFMRKDVPQRVEGIMGRFDRSTLGVSYSTFIYSTEGVYLTVVSDVPLGYKEINQVLMYQGDLEFKDESPFWLDITEGDEVQFVVGDLDVRWITTLTGYDYEGEDEYEG